MQSSFLQLQPDLANKSVHNLILYFKREDNNLNAPALK